MAKGKSSIGFWLLIGTLVVGGGVGMYFLLRKPKDESLEDENLDEKKSILDTPTNIGSGSGSGSGSVEPKISAPSELNSSEKIKKFQEYVLNTKKDKTILGKTGADSEWGKNSQKAWEKYGADFKKTPSYKGFTTVVSSDAKKRIIDFATGNKATESYLNSTNQDLVKKWAESIGNKKTAFIWANQVYRTKTGDKIMLFNPLTTNLKTTKDATLRASANQKSTGTPIKKGQSLGKGSAVAFSNPYLYIYLPNKKKWIWSKVVAKASSSFTGGEEEIWAGFDDNFDITFK